MKRFDIAYIPFTSNLQLNDVVESNFRCIHSPYWRIESGIVAIHVNGNNISSTLMSETIELYRGGLLTLVQACLDNMDAHSICREIWFMRNCYLDDIFAFSLILHKWKYRMKQGWFWISRGSGYPFPHVERGMTKYTSDFDLFKYFKHAIGSGAYSTTHRRKRSKRVFDVELTFSDKQQFNDTIEFRYPGATEELLKDQLWRPHVLAIRNEALARRLQSSRRVRHY